MEGGGGGGIYLHLTPPMPWKWEGPFWGCWLSPVVMKYISPHLLSLFLWCFSQRSSPPGSTWTFVWFHYGGWCHYSALVRETASVSAWRLFDIYLSESEVIRSAPQVWHTLEIGHRVSLKWQTYYAADNNEVLTNAYNNNEWSFCS